MSQMTIVVNNLFVMTLELLIIFVLYDCPILIINSIMITSEIIWLQKLFKNLE
jgi:hypothetical protein